MVLPLCSRQETERFLRDALAESPSDSWRSIVRAIVRGSEEGELWYLVRPEAWGRGIATAAANPRIPGPGAFSKSLASTASAVRNLIKSRVTAYDAESER